MTTFDHLMGFVEQPNCPPFPMYSIWILLSRFWGFAIFFQLVCFMKSLFVLVSCYQLTVIVSDELENLWHEERQLCLVINSVFSIVIVIFIVSGLKIRTALTLTGLPCTHTHIFHTKRVFYAYGLVVPVFPPNLVSSCPSK